MDPSPTPGVIQAGLTPWYYRRMLVLFLMFFGFGCYFAYDWQIGYPKKKVESENAMARYQELYAQGDAGKLQWARESKENKWEIKNQQTMAPEVMTDSKIREQLWGTIVCGVVAAVVLTNFLRSRGTTLKADGEALLLPDGRRAPYSAIRRVDTRKWQNKGLASLWYEEGGRTRKAVIDGLKYGGFKGEKPYRPDQILDRVVDRFHGELIEIREEPVASAAGAEVDAAGPTPAGKPADQTGETSK